MVELDVGEVARVPGDVGDQEAGRLRGSRASFLACPLINGSGESLPVASTLFLAGPRCPPPTVRVDADGNPMPNRRPGSAPRPGGLVYRRWRLVGWRPSTTLVVNGRVAGLREAGRSACRTRSSAEGTSSPRSSGSWSVPGAGSPRSSSRASRASARPRSGRRRRRRARTPGSASCAARPARSERGLTLGGLTDLFADVDADVARPACPSPQRHALEVALLRRRRRSGALPDQRTLSVAVAGAAATADRRRAPVLLADRRRAVARRELGGDPRLCHPTAGRPPDRPAGSLRAGSPGGGARPSRRPRLARADRSDPARADAARVAPPAVPAAARPVVPATRASSGSRRPPAATRCTRWRSPARSSDADIPSTRTSPLPIPDSLGSLMAGRISALPGSTRGALLLAAAAAVPTLETLERARPGAEAALGPAIAGPASSRSTTESSGSATRCSPRPCSVSRRRHELRRAHAAAGRGDAVARRARAPPRVRPRTVRTSRSPRPWSRRPPARQGAAGRRSTPPRSTSRPAGRRRPTSPDRRLDRARLAAECLFVDLSEMVQADAHPRGRDPRCSSRARRAPRR